MAYCCETCGYRSVKWLGHCPSCGEWDSFSEDAIDGTSTSSSSWLGEPLQRLPEIGAENISRFTSGSAELDRLLGGGLVPGAVVLFGGEPGIGKSTLLLQVARAVSAQSDVLYVSGEESAAQIKLRASRLGVDSDRVYVLSEQNLHRVAEAVESVAPRLLIVDSIQTMRAEGVPGEAGNVRQLREVSAELARLTKRGNLSTFLVGHVTKDGGFAGPKVVEHLVDVALYLEGTRGEDVRALRSVKNRFGATNDVALYQMTAAGLKEIADPSRFFLEQHSAEDRTGVAVVPVLEGSRAVLMEVQALVAPTGGYGVPQRRCTGLDVNRVLLLLAVAERQLGVQLGGADVYLSVAGGLEARERGVDLSIVAAIMSSLRNRPIDPRTAVIGEIGLSGELRGVRRLKERLLEVEKLGYVTVVVPERPAPPKRLDLHVATATNISDAMQLLGLV